MSDHFSGPAVIADPASDITDFYAFLSPERPGNLVLIMNVFPLASPQALFSDALTHRFRLRPLTRTGGAVTVGAAEYAIDITFDDATTGAQQGRIVFPDGRTATFTAGAPFERDGVRVFAGLASDPFFMDVEAAIRTDMSGKLAFDTAVNTVQDRDVLTIVVELPFAPVVAQFGGSTLIAALSETLVTRRGAPLRIERVGRAEMKNVILANPMRAPQGAGVELRDLYNREDAFALSLVYRPLYEARFDANLAFWDGLDGQIAWAPDADGRHPLRTLFIDDFLILDLAYGFAPGGFLAIERALLQNRANLNAGGRWLDDDILDELLTLMVSGVGGQRFGDGVDGPTKPARLTFPYVREPSARTDLPLPAFLGG